MITTWSSQIVFKGGASIGSNGELLTPFFKVSGTTPEWLTTSKHRHSPPVLVAPIEPGVNGVPLLDDTSSGGRIVNLDSSTKQDIYIDGRYHFKWNLGSQAQNTFQLSGGRNVVCRNINTGGYKWQYLASSATIYFEGIYGDYAATLDIDALYAGGNASTLSPKGYAQGCWIRRGHGTDRDRYQIPGDSTSGANNLTIDSATYNAGNIDVVLPSDFPGVCKTGCTLTGTASGSTLNVTSISNGQLSFGLIVDASTATYIDSTQFKATASGTVLTVTSMDNTGVIRVGDRVWGGPIGGSTTVTITSLGTGTGGTGTYNLSTTVTQGTAASFQSFSTTGLTTGNYPLSDPKTATYTNLKCWPYSISLNGCKVAGVRQPFNTGFNGNYVPVSVAYNTPSAGKITLKLTPDSANTAPPTSGSADAGIGVIGITSGVPGEHVDGFQIDKDKLFGGLYRHNNTYTGCYQPGGIARNSSTALFDIFISNENWITDTSFALVQDSGSYTGWFTTSSPQNGITTEFKDVYPQIRTGQNLITKFYPDNVTVSTAGSPLLGQPRGAVSTTATVDGNTRVAVRFDDSIKLPGFRGIITTGPAPSNVLYGARFWTPSKNAAFTGTISGTVLTVASVTSGTIVVGMTVDGVNFGDLTEPFMITSLGTGTGGTGTYNINKSLTVGSAISMTGQTAVPTDYTSPGYSGERTPVVSDITGFTLKNDADTNITGLTAASDTPQGTSLGWLDLQHNLPPGFHIADLTLVGSPQRTNLCVQSQNTADANWGAALATKTSTANADPFGTSTALLLTSNGASGAHYISAGGTAISYTTGLAYTFSCYVKAGTQSLVQLTGPGSSFGVAQYANFDLSAGTVTATAGGTATITPVPGGWYRITFTATANATSSANAGTVAFISLSSATRLQTNTLATDFYVIGWQLEQAASASGYIPTSGSAVTVPSFSSRQLQKFGRNIQAGQAMMPIVASATTYTSAVKATFTLRANPGVTMDRYYDITVNPGTFLNNTATTPNPLYVGTAASGTAGASFTLSPGAAAASVKTDRVAVAVISATASSSARTISSVTIGGVTATQVAAKVGQNIGNATGSHVYIYQAVIGTATNVDVVVTFGGTMNCAAATVYTYEGGLCSSANNRLMVYDYDVSENTTFGASPAGINILVPANGIVIGGMTFAGGLTNGNRSYLAADNLGSISGTATTLAVTPTLGGTSAAPTCTWASSAVANRAVANMVATGSSLYSDMLFAVFAPHI